MTTETKSFKGFSQMFNDRKLEIEKYGFAFLNSVLMLLELRSRDLRD